MSAVKIEEAYMVVDGMPEGELEQNNIILTENDILKNTLLFIDGRNYRVIKGDVNNSLVLEKNDEISKFKKSEIYQNAENAIDSERSIENQSCSKPNMAVGKIFNMNMPLSVLQFNCSVCQNVCVNCKYLCVTCKSPCRNCLNRPLQNCSTDTDDFDKYLESLSRKVKLQPKVKTIGTDTCDLDGHFDYYNYEKKAVVVKKSVGTDCGDLTSRRVAEKKASKKEVCVDTSDLNSFDPDKKAWTADSDCEFTWDPDNEPRTYSKISNQPRNEDSNLEATTKMEELGEYSKGDSAGYESCPSNDNVSVKSEDLKVEENKENCNDVQKTHAGKNKKMREIFFDESSTSDESDLDLITSSKVTKSKNIARTFKLSLKEIKNNSEVMFECSICQNSFSKKYLGALHLESHIHNNEYRCLKCDKSFVELNLLVDHTKEHLNGESVKIEINEDNEKVGNQPSNIKCNICDKKFSSKAKMLSHKRFHKRKDKSFECNLCVNTEEIPPKFVSYKALYVHKRLKHGISVKDLKTEKKPRVKREFVCLFCGKEFKSNKALSDHAPVHTGAKNYLCDICNKSYTTSANLQIHKRTHTGLKNFKCTVCDKAFHKKDSLKVHFRKHSGERPFQCDLCPMKFDRNYILKNHRLRHFSEKTFICPICGKAFTTHGGLNNHEKSHKRDPESKKPRKPAVKPTLDTENAVICDVCGKVYSTRSNLRIHKFVHLGIKPYQCPVCQQSYAKKDSMLTHMRKHTDERPFACDTCGMTFYRNHTLKTHQLRHTGERPHKCQMCGKSFTQSSSLAYHLKHHDRREEKKKVFLIDDSNKSQRKKRASTKPGSVTVKKDSKPCKENDHFIKKDPEIPTEILIMKDEVGNMHLPQKDVSFSKGGHFMVPVVDKEVLILDRTVTANTSKNSDFYELDKQLPDASQSSSSKFNYYISKNPVFSFSRDATKSKTFCKKTNDNFVSVIKSEPNENLIVSQNSYITKDGNLVTTTNHELTLKGAKEDFSDISEHGVKAHNTLPIAGQILNPTFISEETGEMVPFSSVTLQTLNADNIMLPPLISIESEDIEKRKILSRSGKFTTVDSKNKCATVSPVKGVIEKGIGKANCHVLNLKDSRIGQRIQVLSPEPIHIQVPTNSNIEDVILHGINTGFYGNIQSNHL